MSEQGQYTYPYPRPMVTVDAVVFTEREGRLHVLLIRRKHDPYADRWALPGGFMEMDETLAVAAARELFEEAGIEGVELEQLRTFDAVDRDPRGRTIGVAFIGVVDARQHAPRAGDDAGDVAWYALDALPPLAFDHADILRYAEERLRTEPRYARALSCLRRAP